MIISNREGGTEIIPVPNKQQRQSLTKSEVGLGQKIGTPLKGKPASSNK